MRRLLSISPRLSLTVRFVAFGGVSMSVHYAWRVPEPIREQLRLAHALREELVSLRLTYEADLQAIWSSFPTVAAAEERIAHAQAACTAAAENAKAERGQSKRGVRGSPAETSAMAALREARQQRRAAITEVHGQAAGRRAARTAEFNAAQRALYHCYVQQEGLFWCTFNDVVGQHLGVVKRVRQQRITRPGATLRHHPFDGTGTIAVQLIRRGVDPPRSPAIVADPNGKYRNYLQLPWTDPGAWNQMSASQQRHAGRVIARMRYGRSTDGQMLLTELPVQQHRQLDGSADITGARLTIRRTPGGLRATLNVSATLPDPDTRRTGTTVAVHLGWRRSPEGIIAVTWRSTRALHIPADLRAVVIAETARTGRLIVPAALNDAFTRADHIRAERGQATRALQRSLVSWLSSREPIDDPRDAETTLDAATVEQWRGAANLHALTRAWTANPPADAESVVALMLRWQRRDARLRRGPDLGQRRHAIAARDDLYRRFAAMLATQAKVLVVDDLALPDLTAASKRRSPGAHKLTATARRIVAPGRLRTLVTSAAVREGCTIIEVGCLGLSRIHGDGCGYENPSDTRYQSATVRCDGCGGQYDQDHAATALMFKRAIKR